MPRPPHLIVRDGNAERRIVLDKPQFTIGRHATTDLQLSAADISRVHAEIVVEDGVWTLYDKQSRFGTFVNGERTLQTVLAPGDQIRCGQTGEAMLIFEHAASDSGSTVVSPGMTTAAADLRLIATLFQGLRALGSGRVVDDVLALVLDSAIEVTGAERGFIMLANRERQLEFKLARARGKITLPGRTFETSRKIPENVFATGQPAIVADLAGGDHAQLHGGTIALGIRHVLCMPLGLVRYVERADQKAASTVIGVLYLDSREPGKLQSPTAQSALDTLSTEAALAIENARLYREALDKAKVEQELRVAAAIQQALLPAPNKEGTFFTAAGASIACRAVGGDFYDYIDLPDGAFGLIVGDVAGKGPPAALLATAALGMFGAEAFYHTSAAALMARLNYGLVRRAIEGRFLTAFYGMLSPDGRLTYSNAAHNAPLLVSASGVRRLTAGGSVLGMFGEGAFDEETVTLEPGDFLVAFSDGVTEALNPSSEEFTDERLTACVEKYRLQSPQNLLDALLADIREFCGDATQSDDLTLVTLRYHA